MQARLRTCPDRPPRRGVKARLPLAAAGGAGQAGMRRPSGHGSLGSFHSGESEAGALSEPASVGPASVLRSRPARQAAKQASQPRPGRGEALGGCADPPRRERTSRAGGRHGEKWTSPAVFPLTVRCLTTQKAGTRLPSSRQTFPQIKERTAHADRMQWRLRKAWRAHPVFLAVVTG